MVSEEDMYYEKTRGVILLPMIGCSSMIPGGEIHI
jgi:hypothetical protein